MGLSQWAQESQTLSLVMRAFPATKQNASQKIKHLIIALDVVATALGRQTCAGRFDHLQELVL